MKIADLLHQTLPFIDPDQTASDGNDAQEVRQVLEKLSGGIYVRPMELVLACCIARSWLNQPIQRDERAEDQRRDLLSLARPVLKSIIPDDGFLVAVAQQLHKPAPL